MSRANIYRPQWGGAAGANTQLAIAASRQLTQIGRDLGIGWRETLRLMGEVWARNIQRSKEMQYRADVEKGRGLERMGRGLGRGIERGVTLKAELDLRKQQMADLEEHRKALRGQAERRTDIAERQAGVYEARERRLSWEGWRKDIGDAVSFAVSQGGKAASRGLDYVEEYDKRNVDLYKTIIRAETDLVKTLGEQRRTGSLRVEEPPGDDVMFGPTKTTYEYKPKLRGADRTQAEDVLKKLREAKGLLESRLGRFAPQTPAAATTQPATTQPVAERAPGPVRVTAELLDQRGLRKPSRARMPTQEELSEGPRAPEPVERAKPSIKPPTEEGEPADVPDKKITDTNRERREPSEKPTAKAPIQPGWRKGWSGPMSAQAVEVLLDEAGLDSDRGELLFQKINAKMREKGHDENQIRKLFVHTLRVLARRRAAELNPEGQEPE